MVGNSKYYSMTYFLLVALMAISCNNSVNKKEVVSTQSQILQDSVITYEISKKSEKQCAEWEVPKQENIIPILNGLKEITGSEWDDCYGDWMCGVEGDLIYRNEKYYYRLDAGGWVILSNETEQKYYACREGQKCWDIFPSESFCNEEGIIKE